MPALRHGPADAECGQADPSITARAFSWLCRAYGAVLTVSAVAKVLAPAAFLLALSTMGASAEQARAVLVAAVFVEAIIGLWLVLRPAGLGAVAGALFSTGLVVGHVAMREAIGDLDCGCFGSIAINDTVALALAGIGIVACTAQHWSGTAPSKADWRIAATVLLLSAGGAVLGHNEADIDADALVAGGLIGVPEDAVVVVGSPTCLKCAAHVGQLVRDGRDVVVLYSESDFWMAKPTTDAAIRVVRVPDIVWVKLVDRAPPTSYLRVDGKLTLFATNTKTTASLTPPR